MKLLALLSLFLFAPLALGNKPTLAGCEGQYAALALGPEELAPAIEIDPAKFNAITQGLRDTLTGNLATVLRSEWKAKGMVQEANQYIQDLLEDFLTPETASLVTHGLDREEKGYIRAVARRLYDMGEQDKINKAQGKPLVLKSGDAIAVRDPAPPDGTRDYTFTYYTRPVADAEGGKHQLRIRNYLREITLTEMNSKVPASAYAKNGEVVTLRRLEPKYPARFEVTSGNAPEETKRVLSLRRIRAEFGEKPLFYAYPHGGKFKMEVKTRLKESVSGSKYPSLAGQNLVQKPDVALSLKQVTNLFAPLPADPTLMAAEARNRLAKLKQELFTAARAKAEKSEGRATTGAEKAAARAEGAASQARTQAVFTLLEAAVAKDPAFLKMEGATLYSRSAFEIAIPDTISGKPVKLQTTVDRDAGSFSSPYSSSGKFLQPTEVFSDLPLIKPASPEEQRHWELKVPQPLVAKEAGLQNGSSLSALPGVELEDGPASPELQNVMKTFSSFNVTNRGKFRHYRQQKPIDDKKPANATHES